MHAPTVPVEAESRSHSSIDALSRAVLAGFVASLMMLLLFFVAYNLARLLSAVPLPTWPALERPSIIHPAIWEGQTSLPAGETHVLETLRQWLVNLTHNRLIDAGLADVYLAAGIYLAGGLLWAILYAVVEPRLGGSPAIRGMTFALIPALVSLVVVLPLLGGGLFGLALGAGPLPAIGNLLLHAAYGAVLGVVYGPFGDLDASTLERPDRAADRVAMGSFERLAALLLVAGLVLGGLAGLVVRALGGDQAGALLAGGSSLGLILWGALFGAAIGLFVASFLGLGRGQPRRRAL